MLDASPLTMRKGPIEQLGGPVTWLQLALAGQKARCPMSSEVDSKCGCPVYLHLTPASPSSGLLALATADVPSSFAPDAVPDCRD